MKAHALSLSFFLAVLPALSHPVAVPAAEAQQSQESWQLPWSREQQAPYMLTVALCVRSSCSVIRGSAPCLSMMELPLLTARPEAAPGRGAWALIPSKWGCGAG